MILFALAAAAWHWLLQGIVPVYQIKGISKLVKLCLPKVQCFCDSLTSPPSERQTSFILPYDKLKNGENFDSLPHRLSSLLFSPSQTVLHVVLSLTNCPPCFSLPHRLSSMLFSPSQTVLHVILSLTDCPPCFSLPHRLSSMLFSPSQTVLHTVLHAILSLTDCPPCYFSPSQTVLPCYSLPHRLSSMLFSPSQTVLHLNLEYNENNEGLQVD
ncbi:unnamed protein product [Ranitomeya imitator]|uniref:Secreted protein n=1 Tax=Ranitomeya imitator TaxID=111125 RepID=A0ABN9KSP5_9NEOB|nr:unnamed protein product [Ranitomeya imitator]